MADAPSAAAPSEEIAVQAVPALKVRGLSLSVLAAAPALLVLREAGAVVVPVLISVLLAYSLAGPVNALTAWRVPRAASVAIVYGLLAVVALMAWRQARDRINDFLDDLPNTI